MDMNRLFDPDVRPAARTGDPDTSHAAAASVALFHLGPVRLAIIDVLKTHGPQTDENIAKHIQHGHPEAWKLTSPSGLRTRRSELVRDGFIHDIGQRAKMSSGRRAVVWHLVES